MANPVNQYFTAAHLQEKKERDATKYLQTVSL
jgi:hypothetical protein